MCRQGAVDVQKTHFPFVIYTGIFFNTQNILIRLSAFMFALLYKMTTTFQLRRPAYPVSVGCEDFSIDFTLLNEL